MITKEQKAEIARQNGKTQLGKTPINAKLFVGVVVGHLTLIERVDPIGSKNKNSIKWKCQCNCDLHTEMIRTSNQLLRKDCRLHCGCLTPRNAHNFKGLEEISGSFLYRVKRNARLRKIEFNITLEDLWEQFTKQNRLCALSGLELSFTEHTASVDRIDSNKPYTKDNIQFLHKDINRIKLDFDEDYFISLCKLIANNRR